jgi:hypothetical protein
MAVSLYPSVSDPHGSVSEGPGVSPTTSVSKPYNSGVVSTDVLLLVAASSQLLLMSGSNLLLMV